MTRCSLENIEAHADELADAFESYEPEPEDENAALPPLMAARLAASGRPSTSAGIRTTDTTTGR